MKLPAPDGRSDLLIARRNQKMARSPHAYVRGNTTQYYEWLHSQRGHALPRGPAIWICGDCHIGNLGPLADADGKVEIRVRDFDQTVVGNPAHDLVRLALSLATSARGSTLPGVVTAHMLVHLMKGYEQALLAAEGAPIAVPKPREVDLALREAVKRTWKKLAQDRFKKLRPKVLRGSNFWPLSKSEKVGISALFEAPEILTLVRTSKFRDDKANVEVIDAAYWVKGCSSLGLLRYAVLLRVDDDYCLMDIKEAVHATSPRYSHVSMPRDNAKRVMTGAAKMSPALGDRIVAQHFLSSGVFIRELLPQDLKLEIDRLNLDDATQIAEYLAYVLGCAHARQMDDDTRETWRRELVASRGNSHRPPAWLWDSVVELVASHEAGYLEHCCKYVLGTK